MIFFSQIQSFWRLFLKLIPFLTIILTIKNILRIFFEYIDLSYQMNPLAVIHSTWPDGTRDRLVDIEYFWNIFQEMAMSCILFPARSKLQPTDKNCACSTFLHQSLEAISARVRKTSFHTILWNSSLNAIFYYKWRRYFGSNTCVIICNFVGFQFYE